MCDYFVHPAVESLDHAIGLGMAGFYETVLKAGVLTDQVEGVSSCGLALTIDVEAVRELLAVVCQDFRDLKWGLIKKSLEEGGGRTGGLVLEDFDVHPSCRPVYGRKEIAVPLLVRHPWQILHVHMDESRLIVLEGLPGACLFLLGKKYLEISRSHGA